MSRRPSRWLNPVPLLAVAFASATGVIALTAGTPSGRWTDVVHAVVGWSVPLLVAWTLAVRRPRLGLGGKVLPPLTVALAVCVGLAVATGLLHAGGVRRVPGVTTMQLHLGAGLGALGLVLAHLVVPRLRPSVDPSRRAFLRAGAGLAVAGGAVAAFETFVGADRRFTGSFEEGSDDPARMPATQWLGDEVPDVDATSWRLELPLRDLTYGDVDSFREPVRAVLDCTGGWWSEQLWEGIHLDALLPRRPEARSIVVHSVTGYRRRFPIDDAPRLLLATRVGGAPLARAHGYPARLVAPGRRGFWWVKWVHKIELSNRPWWVQSPFPWT